MPKKLPIFYSALLLTGVNLLLRLVSTAFQVYISGRIGAAGVGLVQLMMSVGFLATTIAVAGVRTTAMYLTAEELGHKKAQHIPSVLSGCFAYSILCSSAVAAALYYFAPLIGEKWIGNSSILGALRLYAGFLPISCLCGVMSGYFTAANRIGTLAVVEIAEQVISMGATLWLLNAWAGSDPGKACQAMVLGGGISGSVTLTCLVFLRLKERPSAGRSIPIRKRLLRCAAPLALADTAKAGINTLENLMVPKRLAMYSGTTDPLAAFGTICGMVFPVLMFPAAILFGLAELLIPELARCAAAGSGQRIAYLVRRTLRTALLYGCLCGGILFLIAEPICIRLYSSQEAGLWLRRFSLLIPMLYCDAVTDAMTKGLGQQKVCVRFNILTSAMDVILLFFLLPRWGIHGYFASFLLTHLINFLLSLRHLLRITHIHMPFHVPLVALLSTVAAVFAANLLHPSPGRILCYLLILGCLLFLGKILRREDISWALGLIRKSDL